MSHHYELRSKCLDTYQEALKPMCTGVTIISSMLGYGQEVDLLSELPFSDESHIISKRVGELEGLKVFNFFCWIRAPD